MVDRGAKARQNYALTEPNTVDTIRWITAQTISLSLSHAVRRRSLKGLPRRRAHESRKPRRKWEYGAVGASELKGSERSPNRAEQVFEPFKKGPGRISLLGLFWHEGEWA